MRIIVTILLLNLLNLTTLFSQSNKLHLNPGRYINTRYPNFVFEYSEDYKCRLVDKNVSPQDEGFVLSFNSDNSISEMTHSQAQSFNNVEIDSITEYGTFITLVDPYDQKNPRTYHIQINYPFIILTACKNKSGIKYHYMEPMLYVEESKTDLTYTSNVDTLDLKFINPKLGQTYYLHYNEEFTQEDISIVEFSSDKFEKSIDRYPNPAIHASFLYKCEVSINGEVFSVPVITQEHYHNTKARSPRGNPKLALIAYRFNPSRGIVNKRFNKTISGQVQNFEFVLISPYDNNK